MNAENTAAPPPTTPPTPNGLPQPALAADSVSQVLRPLARLMIDHGLQLIPMVELLKKALVDEAMSGYGLADKGSTDTRVALLTGVHRKDVKRLREQPHADATPPMVPLAASVVARWISDPRYLHADRSPRALARTPGRGQAGEPDFTQLVAEVSRDVGARAVLDELVRLGVVELTDEGLALLKTKAFVPQGDQGDAFHFLAANVSDHLATAVHNLQPGRVGEPMLEQSAFSHDLTAHQANELHALARQLWANALQQFLQTATVAEERSLGAEGPKQRIRFGVYLHQVMQPLPACGAGKPAKRPPRAPRPKRPPP